MKRLIVVVLTLLLTPLALAEVVGKEVTYQSGDTSLHGYLAVDKDITGNRPGILVVHEWCGHNEYARKRARMLAELGYTALAVDMYGDGRTADHPDDAGKFAGEVRKNMPVAEDRFRAAMELLQSQPGVEAKEIAAIGYCFGGGVVLEMARRGVDLKGVASFHGSLGTSEPAQKGRVKARVLVFNGDDDPFVKPEHIEAFKKEMDAADVVYRFIGYPGAKHSFTNPDADTFGKKFGLPLEYNAEVDKQSWAELQKFFAGIFD